MRRQAAAITVGEGKRSDRTALDPGGRIVAFKAKHHVAELPVVTKCAADQAAPHRKTTAIEGSGIGIFSVPPASASLDANVETGPVVGQRRGGRGRWPGLECHVSRMRCAQRCGQKPSQNRKVVKNDASHAVPLLPAETTTARQPL